MFHSSSMFSKQSAGTQQTRTSRTWYYMVDMEGSPVGPLRLWRFSEDEVVEGNTYIIRGLKVGEEVQWDDDQWKWVPRQNGVRALESTVRTALEDVTAVEDIERCFQGW